TRLRAEVLLDAVTDITGVPTNFEAVPTGARATQIWTTRVNSVFLDTFGRPNENQDPPCERQGEATVTQTLHLMNAPELHARLTSEQGRAAQLAASPLTPAQLTTEIYLLVYGRLPVEEELQVGERVYATAGSSRRQATEDLMWALLNTPEFAFKD
ncbi:MAG TPA: DUF1553 domain-containing protein, partial [Pirellulaceae bacterium]|nr:DUF1553 domain-containing protein [Pirellulaceae bacterium]